MLYESNEVEARMLKKEEAFLRFYAENDHDFRVSEKEALERMKRYSGRLKHE